ncbi:type II toxin-antitoxin system mRNA interferase toxin, RelE/StbE family [Streptococcus sp. SL1232]|uniref:type II toxin-antitoxin system mRNA interferase toxin, RelE/StbE family n=1 Tax=Streptococcus TaxID=1301 RepID=UPI0018F5E853|nr:MULTISPECIES: type II toxin-antitoxin system mRNA interferase toxin, RelE/StbE family [Streptococcus]MBJ7541432.1 type II toxin-antitoxin system mRNA interferase toxin, RelE/StbE family [Streptococcus vicugnae]
MDKLDRGRQKVIARWIDKYLIDVVFPQALGKYLAGMLSDYIRFRVGYYIITKVNDEDFVIMNVHIAK